MLLCLGLVAFLCIFEAVQFSAGFIESVRQLYSGSDAFSTVVGTFYLGVSLFALYALLLLIFSARLPVKIIAFSILILVIFTEFSYLRSVGRFTNTFDITAAMSATSEQKIDSIGSYASFVWIPFVLVVGLLAYFLPDRSKRHGLKSSAVWLAIMIVYYVQVILLGPLLVDRRVVSSSFDAFAQTAIGYLVSKPAEMIAPPKRAAVAQPRALTDSPNRNIVFIFDESVRGDHLSLNGYHRKTTPYLEELAKMGKLKNWGIAVSASTSSHPSYDAFITGATPEMLATRSQHEIGSMPTLFQYAKAMNFKTHLFDGQMKYYWGGIKEDLNSIDNYVNLNNLAPDRIEDFERGGKFNTSEENRVGLKQWEIDQQLAKLIKEIFETSTGNFIFLYKRGVHFPYEKNYPKDAAKWEPVYTFKSQWDVPPPEALPLIVNSYDNSIRYNLDNFFKTLVGEQNTLPNRTTVIYTSDHGESLYVGGKAGHGGETREEANVPLFTLGLDGENVDTSFLASHANVFSTLLDLFAYPNDLRGVPYAVSLLNATKKDSRPRSFNLTDGRKVRFDP